jgi:hypothetical protein
MRLTLRQLKRIIRETVEDMSDRRQLRPYTVPPPQAPKTIDHEAVDQIQSELKKIKAEINSLKGRRYSGDDLSHHQQLIDLYRHEEELRIQLADALSPR